MRIDNYIQPSIPSLETNTLGGRLHLARFRAGISLVRVADRLGVSRNAVSAWERDASMPKDIIGVVNIWSELTGISKNWIAFGSEPGDCQCQPCVFERIGYKSRKHPPTALSN